MSEDEIILTHLLKCSRADLLLGQIKLDSSQAKIYQEYKSRRLAKEPLQYILGTWNFFGLEFKINPSVLIPRPETEGLVDLALKCFKGTDILDLGTGSGCIAVTMAKYLPYVQVTALDASVEAIEVALVNAQEHGVESRIDFIHADMNAFLQEDQKRYDLIVSNPPYISSMEMKNLPAEVLHEPTMALDGGVDGLDFYRVIIKTSPRLISGGGCLMMEFGDGQGQAIKEIVNRQPLFSHCDIFKDLAGKDRVIICYVRSN